MDAPEADFDIKLQKISSDLLADFNSFLDVLHKPASQNGGERRYLDPFQELPQLLDPHLPKWIPFLANTYLAARTTRHKSPALSAEKAKHFIPTTSAIALILYTFCKIRGEKVIKHFLNVETKYLEILLSAIEDAEGKGTWAWQERYIVLVWLSHLLLAPFDLSTISSVDVEDAPAITGLELREGLPGITLRLLPLGIKFLSSPGKERDGAKALLVRIAMRQDMQDLGVLDSLIKWALGSLRADTEQTSYYYLGILSFIGGILQSTMDTGIMHGHLSAIFTRVHGVATEEGNAIDRLGGVADEITEMTIGYLLESLADNDTPVRLAASKALSVITLKLDPEMASQVVEAVLESLNKNILWKKTAQGNVRDLATVDSLEWHGLILTLSHLLYRRSPPAEQLPDIIQSLLLGLAFEQRGTSGTSVGANVRDAACFGIWAVARRYTTAELLAVPTRTSTSILQTMGTELVTTACIDPAGNIRRGSSAALQELIGRHPDTVEKGIWVVQTVDYHAVARRSRAMEEVALGVTKLCAQYGEAILNALLGWRGVGDVDAASRRSAGAAFGVLTAALALDDAKGPFPRYEASFQLFLDKYTTLEARQVEERHGLLICYAALLDQFPKVSARAGNPRIGKGGMSPSAWEKMQAIVTTMLTSYMESTHRRADLIAEGLSQVVVSLAPLFQSIILGKESSLPLYTMAQLLKSTKESGHLALANALDEHGGSDSDLSTILDTIKQVVPIWLSRTEPEAMEPASSAALTLLIFSTPPNRKAIIHEWAKSVRHKPSSRTAAQGEAYFYTLALTQPLISSQDADVVCEALTSRWADDTEVATRVAILQGLTKSRILQDKPLAFLGILKDGLNDYTTTARGDVGSHVRVQALRAVCFLWQDAACLSKESIETLLHSVLRLSAEKLDRIRPEAQSALALLLSGHSADHFRHSLTFSSQAYFHILLALAYNTSLHPFAASFAEDDETTWMAALMAGFVTSADTGNEELVIASRAALTSFANVSASNLDLIYGALIQNLRTHQGNDRVLVPTLEIIAFLLHVGFVDTDINFKSMCLQTQKAGYKTGNVRKIEACVRVYGGIAGLGDENIAGVSEARKRLGALLFHPWPKVRTMVADEIWGLVVERDDTETDDGLQSKVLGVDWGAADKTKIRSLVQDLHLN
ncbi:Tubulin-specific chaperone D-like protein [Emericellopsis cladophorae]|uniref:Tubulin-specific chaperone D-like protein n=1 Tax=Emericellopsis cladophorae TaxID=2686198 RepID=A0A9P9Y8Q2_9HYPO|nr:Tubulin-specific chaperone D-like protein [Emericellopsis cladophorae]KAI6785433.1 Tubulin-specific chaperone D-like protein [Emericellopsis cladophorae]